MSGEPSRLALLIGSSSGDLAGTSNDVELMEAALASHGFKLTKLVENESTRNKILAAWETLTNSVEEAKKLSALEPVVLIYFSGHGGVAEPREPSFSSHQRSLKRRRYQFLVTADYETAGSEFNGIIDLELASLLERTTNQTKNVTLILDCCHSGRMARDPSHPDAKPKRLPLIKHAGLSGLLNELEERGLTDESTLEGNQDAVRIMAAASDETAWECKGSRGKTMGVLTDNLVSVLADPNLETARVSWRTTMMRVSAAVTMEFPTQNPCAEGRYKRILFTTQESDDTSFGIFMRNNEPVLHAGSFHGVEEGDVYSVMPSGSEAVNEDKILCEVEITSAIESNSSVARFTSGKCYISQNGGVAFLKERKLHRWPTAYPQGLTEIESNLLGSKFLKPHQSNERTAPLVEIRELSGNFEVLDFAKRLVYSKKVQLPVPPEIAKEIVNHAETVVRKHHLLCLQKGTDEMELSHDLTINFGLMNGPSFGSTLTIDGKAEVYMNDKIYINLINGTLADIHVSVFAIDGAGEINLLTANNPKGVNLPRGRSYLIWKKGRGGLTLMWPEKVPLDLKKLTETLVFVVTNKPVDLRHFETKPENLYKTRGIGNKTDLERLLEDIMYGIGRGPEPEDIHDPLTYDVQHIPYTLKARV